MQTDMEFDVIEQLKNTQSLLEGHFELSSGLHSSQYFQCAKLLQFPDIAQQAAQQLAKKLDDQAVTIVGPALGGLIIGYEVARAMGKRSVFVERKDGQMCLRRGFEISKGEKVIIVEDVITTAKSALEAARVIEKLGGEVIGYGCIVDRSAGKTDLNISSLVQIDPVVYEPDNCPMCQKGSMAIKPGSRNS